MAELIPTLPRRWPTDSGGARDKGAAIDDRCLSEILDAVEEQWQRVCGQLWSNLSEDEQRALRVTCGTSPGVDPAGEMESRLHGLDVSQRASLAALSRSITHFEGTCARFPRVPSQPGMGTFSPVSPLRSASSMRSATQTPFTTLGALFRILRVLRPTGRERMRCCALQWRTSFRFCAARIAIAYEGMAGGAKTRQTVLQVSEACGFEVTFADLWSSLMAHLNKRGAHPWQASVRRGYATPVGGYLRGCFRPCVPRYPLGERPGPRIAAGITAASPSRVRLAGSV